MAEGGVLSTLARLETELVGRLCRPGDDGYAAARSPRSASGSQAPLAVVSVVDSGDIVAALRWAADAGLRVAVQATGHGAAGTIADDVLLLDASGLDDVALDGSRAIAPVGAGVRSAALTGRAHRETGIRPDTDLDEPALAEVELRHLVRDAPVAPGALTTPPGEYLLHAVGLAPDVDARTRCKPSWRRRSRLPRPTTPDRRRRRFAMAAARRRTRWRPTRGEG